jgi:hypothetical protein
VIVSYVGQSGTRYGGSALEASKVGAEPVVVVTSGTLRGERPEGGAGSTTGVRVDVLPRGGAARLRAFGPGGEMLGEATTAGLARQSLNVNAAGIARITVDGVGGTPVVFQVCWTLAPANPLAELVAQADTSLPRVTFYDAAGKSVTVTAAQLGAGASAAAAPAADTALTLGATAAAVANPCAKFTFALPAPSGAAGAGGWVRAEVHAWRRGPVTFIAACGVTLEAAQAQADDATFRGSLVDLLGELAADATANEPTRAVYLERDATYQLRVGWQYQGFRPAAPGDEAPPPAADAWIDAPELDRYTFRTAAFGTVAPPAPAAENGLETDPAQGGPGYDERVFDPRGVARFVTRAAPNHEDPPHFLDDPVGFWFLADHLESLLEKYDRVLQVRVLHTRHAPGALHGAPAPIPGGAHPLDVTIEVSKRIETTTWFDPDLRFSEAVAAAPCVGAPPALGSSSLTVKADLAPGSEYDLLLKAVPATVGASAEIVIARNHFSTSRYRSPTELLRALGFRAPTGSQPPVDAIAAAPLAAAPPAVGDAALDAALASLGMDPWPLPAGPRTTVIWERPAGPGAPWRVAGVLLEADEPIWRAGFRTGEAGEADPPPRLDVERLKLMGRVGDTTFSIGDLGERVRNAAGTRILFAAATPFALAGAQSYALDLTVRERGSTGASGQSPLFDRPMVVFQEGA